MDNGPAVVPFSHRRATTTGMSRKIGRDRTRLNFANAVSERFSFLRDLGFTEVDSLPTIVRYRKGDIEVHIYHGRQSFEIGFEIGRQGAHYSMSELIRADDPQTAEQYLDYAATTAEGTAEGLAQLEELVKRYGERALRGDSEFFGTLANQRKTWAAGYELDVLAKQLRPKADAAFRSSDYRQAAELYEKIRPRLSVAELKKLELAKERAGR